jgi:protein TonB
MWRQPYAYATPDAKEPSNRVYLATVQKRVTSKWVYPRSAGERGIEGNAVIDFYIAKDGHLEDAKLTRSSGTAILDDAALVAVKLAQPFPPMPDTLCKDSVGITGTFRYKLKNQ